MVPRKIEGFEKGTFVKGPDRHGSKPEGHALEKQVLGRVPDIHEHVPPPMGLAIVALGALEDRGKQKNGPGLEDRLLLERCPVPIHANTVEAEGVRRVTGASASDLVAHESGDVIEVGEVRIRLIHTPGHTPGSQCFLVEAGAGPGHLVSGDTLFLGSCGRVDLPGSDPEAMYHSLHDKLGRLPDETLLFPGHLYSSEPSSSIGEQKRTNPYLRVDRLDDFLRFMGR